MNIPNRAVRHHVSRVSCCAAVSARTAVALAQRTSRINFANLCLIFIFSSKRAVGLAGTRNVLPNADPHDAVARHSGTERIPEFAQVFLSPQITGLQFALESEV